MSTMNNPAYAAMLDALADALDPGFVYVFAGTMPATASEALNMATTHTQVAMLSVAGDGVTGLTFEDAVGPVLSKETTQDWEGLADFDGFVAGPGTITPLFFRMCASGDNGRTLNTTTARLQGTVGGPASTADMKLAADTVTDNGVNTVIAAGFNIRLSNIG